MKIYLDDLRSSPAGWMGIKSADDVVRYLKTGCVKELSLDHDLGDENLYGSGYDVICWLEEKVFSDESFIPPKISIHSQNSIGVRKMFAGLNKINFLLSKR